MATTAFPPHLCVAAATHDYKGDDATGTVSAGQLLLVQGDRDDAPAGWVYALSAGEQPALVPASYLTLQSSTGFTALALYDFECHCDDVLLGACAVVGLTTCAVDVDSCAAGATWLSARDVYDAGTHCRLCTLSTPAPTPTPAEANAVAGSFTVTGLSVADATSHEDVFRAAIATLARVSADDVSVAFTEGSERRRRLLDRAHDAVG